MQLTKMPHSFDCMYIRVQELQWPTQVTKHYIVLLCLGGGDLETFYGIVTLIYTLDKLISHKNSLYYLEKVLDTSISIGSNMLPA